MIAAGAVRMDEKKIEDPKCTVSVGQTVILQVGRRRMARLRILPD